MIKFLLEAYENIMDMSTIDESLPKVQITVAPDFLEDAKEILADLAKNHFFMLKLDETSTKSMGNY